MDGGQIAIAGMILANVATLIGVYTSLRVDIATIIANQVHFKGKLEDSVMEQVRIRELCDRRAHVRD